MGPLFVCHSDYAYIQLTPWSTVLIEKFTVTQLTKQLPIFYKNPTFNYRIHKTPVKDPALSQCKLVHSNTT